MNQSAELCRQVSGIYIRFFASFFPFLAVRELELGVFPDRFDFLLSFYFSIPLFNNRTKLGSGISYSIMAEMLLEDLLILSLISLVCTVS